MECSFSTLGTTFFPVVRNFEVTVKQMQPLPNTFRTLVPFIFFLCPYTVSFTHVVTVVISPPSPRIEAVFQAESVSRVTLNIHSS